MLPGFVRVAADAAFTAPGGIAELATAAVA
jgi:hypothetical protein